MACSQSRRWHENPPILPHRGRRGACRARRGLRPTGAATRAAAWLSFRPATGSAARAAPGSSTGPTAWAARGTAAAAPADASAALRAAAATAPRRLSLALGARPLALERASLGVDARSLGAVRHRPVRLRIPGSGPAIPGRIFRRRWRAVAAAPRPARLRAPSRAGATRRARPPVAPHVSADPAAWPPPAGSARSPARSR